MEKPKIKIKEKFKNFFTKVKEFFIKAKKQIFYFLGFVLGGILVALKLKDAKDKKQIKKNVETVEKAKETVKDSKEAIEKAKEVVKKNEEIINKYKKKNN